jgi:hypothetical protein
MRLVGTQKSQLLQETIKNHIQIIGGGKRIVPMHIQKNTWMTMEIWEKNGRINQKSLYIKFLYFQDFNEFEILFFPALTESKNFDLNREKKYSHKFFL